MTSADLVVFARDLGGHTKTFVSLYVLKAIEPLQAKIAAVEAALQGVVGQQGEPGPTGEKGLDGVGVVGATTTSEGHLLLSLSNGNLLNAGYVRGESGRHGKDADGSLLSSLQSDVSALRAEFHGKFLELSATIDQKITDVVTKAFELRPLPHDGRDGRDVDMAAVEILVKSAVSEHATSFTERMSSELQSMITTAVSAIPVPKDGRDGQSVTVSDIRPLIESEVQKRAATIPHGKDGVGVISVMPNLDGQLVVTYTDGRSVEVGYVKGEDGKDGQNVDPQLVKSLVEQQTEEILATWPKPKDGQDGKDGLGFDDLSMHFDPQKGFALRFVKGDRIEDFPLHTPWYSGPWKAGTLYTKGAGVVCRNSFWIAVEDTNKRPGEGHGNGWKLAAKGMQDGRPDHA